MLFLYLNEQLIPSAIYSIQGSLDFRVFGFSIHPAST